MKYLALVAAVFLSGCGALTPPTGPSRDLPTPPPVTAMSYAINLPSPGLVIAYWRVYPDGLQLDPYTAQQDYDETRAYGVPNVYVGESAPRCPIVGTVVAPLHVATMAQFTAGDWPSVGLLKGVTYVWVARFVFAEAPASPPRRCVEPTPR